MRQFVATCLAVVVWPSASRWTGALLNKPVAPLRGWNSYDAFGVSNESVTLAVADGLVSSGLRAAGYSFLTLDAGWFGPGPHVRIDAWGRPVGSAQLYPASAGGAHGGNGSMKGVADAVHARGLGFGLWYMAGVPQASFDANSPIKGTNYTVRDIAVAGDTYCPRWDKSWGLNVNHSHPATQAWYNSLVELWADWDLDLLKLDCVNAEDESTAHRLDIIAISRALQATDRPVVFSLSPGGFTNVSQANDVRDFVTMARSTDDFWDNWTSYMDSGGGGGAASGYSHWDAARDIAPVARSAAPTFWPDLDMLPFGRIGHVGQPCAPTGPGCPRQSRFTIPEMKSILTLWSLVQSPLLFGGDARAGTIPDAVLGLLTEPLMLALGSEIQYAAEAVRRVGEGASDGGYIVWRAVCNDCVHVCGAHVVAVFNLDGSPATHTIRWMDVGVAPTAGAPPRDLWANGTAFQSWDASGFTATLEPHGCLLLKFG